MLQHYVFLKYRDGTSRAHVQAFCERMLALRATIPANPDTSRSGSTSCTIRAAGTSC